MEAATNKYKLKVVIVGECKLSNRAYPPAGLDCPRSNSTKQEGDKVAILVGAFFVLYHLLTEA